MVATAFLLYHEGIQLSERHIEKTERTELIDAVCKKLVKPAMSHIIQ